MKKLIFLIILAIVTGCMLASFRTLPVMATIPINQSGPPNPQAFYGNEDLANNGVHPVDAASPSCANPTPDEVRECDELERQVLASTVRLEWHLWIINDDGSGYTFVDGSTGHATIKEGRYLVTHNHPGVSPSELKDGEFITVSIFTANGEPIWLEARLMTITIALEEAETLALDFDDYGDQGLFAAMGMSSAEFKAWGSLPLQPGMEVAQIEWDGATAHVDWVTIDDVITESGTARLELANFVRPGASGGGVFWNGYHVANTWSQVTTRDEDSGAVLRQYSVAALNSTQVAAQFQ
jgi:hypothetical protein